MRSKPRITVLGAGSFGTAMACLLKRKGLDVTLWVREKTLATEIEQNRTNTLYFEGLALDPFRVKNDLATALADQEVLIFAIPCQYLRRFLMDIKGCLTGQSRPPILVNLAKGIEIDTLMLPHQIFKDVLGDDTTHRYCALSGPTFAKELYQNVPSGAAIASAASPVADKIQHLLSSRFFRLYAATDLVGVELGGALKNVMALGVGIADGLGFGLNTRAGLITRCLHEMSELGVAMGARHQTFSGLSGVGDLILTCTGDLSRNRQVGLRVGRGEKIAAVLKSMKHVAEGVPTAKSVYQLNQRHKVEMPNAEHVYKIIYEDLSPLEAVTRILARDLKREFE